VANDKNQYLKGPEFATSIGLLMESLKIRDKNPTEEEIIEEELSRKQLLSQLLKSRNLKVQQMEEVTKPKEEAKRNKPTFGQSLLEKVKKFFEEVE
jgi:cell division protein FtsA